MDRLGCSSRNLKRSMNKFYSVSFSANTDIDISIKAKKILICLCKDIIAEATRLAHFNRRPTITKGEPQKALRLLVDDMSKHVNEDK
jgi:hypothetical protein